MGKHSERLRRAAEEDARRFNEHYAVGTPVRYWPGLKEGEGRRSKTRSEAWALPSGAAVVMVEGHPGGIALTHVEIETG